MEATSELGKKIVPPRLEDAGLEDCALPPDAIREAFLRAASAVGSRAASVLNGGDCVSDPWTEDRNDAVVGSEPGKGAQDKVVDGSEEVGDKGEDKEACVDGIRGLGIEEEEVESEGEGTKPILVEGCV